MDVEIDEIDVCPVQIQGPKSLDADGRPRGRGHPGHSRTTASWRRKSPAVRWSSRSPASPGRRATRSTFGTRPSHAEKLWYAVLEAGRAHQLMVIAPGHQRRIQAGILSWGQDIDHETVPFQCNLAYQVPRRKAGDYIGRAALERMREEIEAGRPPFAMVMVGMTMGGRPIDDYAPDFWLVSDAGGGDPIGYLTSPWHAPELGTNIAMGYVPTGKSAVGTELAVWLPDEYASEPGKAGARKGVRGAVPRVGQPERPRDCPLPGRGRDGLARCADGSSTASPRSSGSGALPGRARGVPRAPRDAGSRRPGARHGRGGLRSPFTAARPGRVRARGVSWRGRRPCGARSCASPSRGRPSVRWSRRSGSIPPRPTPTG